MAHIEPKGGFERSQSERLDGYGIFAIVLVLLLLQRVGGALSDLRLKNGPFGLP
jgi:hypothetical protein